jgi:hypothetical protein
MQRPLIRVAHNFNRRTHAALKVMLKSVEEGEGFDPDWRVRAIRNLRVQIAAEKKILDRMESSQKGG